MGVIIVTAIIKTPINKVWNYWIRTNHITKWNFASNDWYCPKADNNLLVGGEFHYQMAAKDGSFSFDFWGTYTKIESEKLIEIILGDGRTMSVQFEKLAEGTKVTESFEPEGENSLELQKMGWQSILDNFKNYVANQED